MRENPTVDDQIKTSDLVQDQIGRCSPGDIMYQTPNRTGFILPGARLYHFEVRPHKETSWFSGLVMGRENREILLGCY